MMMMMMMVMVMLIHDGVDDEVRKIGLAGKA